jgi:guanine deaminase
VRGTAVAHCPLSNAYFSAKPFPLREALQLSVAVGLGTDIAGGYSVDIMDAMRQAIITSRMREGAKMMARTEGLQEGLPEQSLSIDWKESLYIATRGGAQALDLPPGSGLFQIGAPFDVQCSE